MKNKILLGLSFTILLTGCGTDLKGNAEKRNVLTCSQIDEDSGLKFEYKMNYNESWTKIEKTTATMSLDVSELSKEDLDYMKSSFEEECEEAGDQAESCIVKVEKKKLIFELVGDIGKFDENPVVTSDSSLEEVKTYFEDDGLTCKTTN